MIKNLIVLLKLRITLLVIITSYLGYYLGLRYLGYVMVELETIIKFFHLVIGVLFTASASGILNQYFEVDLDAKMNRTMLRPLPTGAIKKRNALILGLAFSFFGTLYLYLLVNPLTASIAFLTILSYICVYTPSKTRSRWNTIIGSFPGALPPVGGWTAATNEINSPALVLFLILFCWQIPHFLSLAIIYKDDYKKAGFKMLPSVSNNLDSTLFQIVFFIMALIVSSVGIYLLKLTSIVYMLGAVLLGTIFLVYSANILFEQSNKKIKKLFIFSIIYLPLLMILIIVDTLLL
jgi:protoheme IX farnesyltransferase